jgi:hypothetical protein
MFTSIQSLLIPSSISLNEDFTFYNYFYLIFINLPEGIKWIINYPFYNTLIVTLNFPQTLTYIAEISF